MDQVFGGLIDRIRGPLDIRTVETLFGRRQRPVNRVHRPRRSRSRNLRRPTRAAATSPALRGRCLRASWLERYTLNFFTM